MNYIFHWHIYTHWSVQIFARRKLNFNNHQPIGVSQWAYGASFRGTRKRCPLIKQKPRGQTFSLIPPWVQNIIIAALVTKCLLGVMDYVLLFIRDYLLDLSIMIMYFLYLLNYVYICIIVRSGDTPQLFLQSTFLLRVSHGDTKQYHGDTKVDF